MRGLLDDVSGVLDVTYFEHNSKQMSQAYDAFVLSVGDFDERIFLGEGRALIIIILLLLVFIRISIAKINIIFRFRNFC